MLKWIKKNNISTINRSEIKLIVCTLEVIFYFKLIISTEVSLFFMNVPTIEIKQTHFQNDFTTGRKQCSKINTGI